MDSEKDIREAENTLAVPEQKEILQELILGITEGAARGSCRK